MKTWHGRLTVVTVLTVLAITANGASVAVPAAAHDLGATGPAGLTYQNCHEVVPFVEVDYKAADDLVPDGYTVFKNSAGNANLFLNTIGCESITVGGVTVKDVIESHLSIFIVPPYPDDPVNPSDPHNNHCTQQPCPAQPPHPSFVTPARHVESAADSQLRLESYLLQWVTNSKEYARWLRQGTGLGDRVHVVPGMVFDYDPRPGHVPQPGYAPAVDDSFFAKVPPPAPSPFHVGCDGGESGCYAVITEPVPVTFEEGINWWADTEEGTVIIHSEFHLGPNQRFGTADGTLTSDDENSPLGKLFGASKDANIVSQATGEPKPSRQTKRFSSTDPELAAVSGEFTNIQLTKCVRNAANPCSADNHPPPEAAASSGTDDASCDPTKRRELLAAEQRAVLDLVGDLTTLRDHHDLAALAAVGYKDYDHHFVSFAGQGLAILDFTRFADVRPGNPSFLLYEPSPDADDVTDIEGPDFPYSLAGWGYAGPNYSYNREKQEPVWPHELDRLCLGAGDWFVHERGIHPSDTGGMHSVPPEEQEHGHASGDSFPIPGIEGPVGFPHPRIWDIHLWLGPDGVPSISILNPGKCIPGIPSDVGVAWFHPEDDHREVGREHCGLH